MGGINIAPRMARKKIVKDLKGGIIDMIDETDGGYIIRGRQVVNQEKWEEYLKKEADKKEAAQAMAKAIHVPPEVAEARAGNTSAMKEIKEEMAEFKKEVNDKFSEILQAIKGK